MLQKLFLDNVQFLRGLYKKSWKTSFANTCGCTDFWSWGISGKFRERPLYHFCWISSILKYKGQRAAYESELVTWISRASLQCNLEDQCMKEIGSVTCIFMDTVNGMRYRRSNENMIWRWDVNKGVQNECYWCTCLGISAGLMVRENMYRYLSWFWDRTPCLRNWRGER